MNPKWACSNTHKLVRYTDIQTNTNINEQTNTNKKTDKKTNR